MKKVNIALVGCGGMAALYRHIYTEVPGAQLALIIDINEEVAKSAAQTLQIERWSTNFTDCLSPEIDVVDISTPNHFHRDQAVAAMQAGKHVLLQKPLASNVAEAEHIVRTAGETGVIAGMYMSLFDNPVFYEIKDIINEGKLGVITGAHCRVAHTGGLTMDENNWRKSGEQTGGGSFIQLAIHNINMAQWLIDSRIISVSAYSHNLHCPNVGGDDMTVVACEFNTGALGTISSAYCANKDELVIYGTKGYISVDDTRHVSLRLSEARMGKLLPYDTPNMRKTFDLPFDSFTLFDSKNPCDQHVAFIKAVQANEPPQIHVSVGLYDMKIVQAVYESARQEKRVYIKD